MLLPRNIGPGMGTEFVYRGHARGLLERVAAGTDLRLATAAELWMSRGGPVRPSQGWVWF
jgi:hypothetical protein